MTLPAGSPCDCCPTLVASEDVFAPGEPPRLAWVEVATGLEHTNDRCEAAR